MRIGYVQTDPVFGRTEGNRRQVEELVGEHSADLLVLPELFATGYTFASADEARELAEPADGPTAQFLRVLARRVRGALVAGFAESDGAAVYNSAMLVTGAGVLAVYRKIHLFNREKLWFLPGDRAPMVVDLGAARVGLMICFDWIFPETARSLALAGADVIAHPSNLVLPYCQAAMVTRCLENRVLAVTANRIGVEERGEDRFAFTGSSQVTGHDGTVLAHGPADRADIEVVEVDPGSARGKKLNPFNDLFADRRPALYRLGRYGGCSSPFVPDGSS